MIILQSIESEQIVNLADSAKVSIAQFADNLSKDPNTTLKALGNDAIEFGLKLLAAIVIYIIGAWLIKRIKITIGKIMSRHNSDNTLSSFVSSLVTITLTILLILTVVGTLGVNTTSLAALLAAGGVAIGMALSGTAQNFAGGIMILAFKPFKAGDFIEAQGFSGTVSSVSIVSTTLTTPDNKIIVLPNGSLFNGNISNYSKNGTRRVDWVVSVNYGSNSQKVKETLLAIAKEDQRILDSTNGGAADIFVAIDKLDTSSVNYVVRAWVKKEDYWDVYFDFNQRVYTSLPSSGIQFPYRQLDIHIKERP